MLEVLSMARRDTTTRDRHREAIRRTGAGCHICGGAIDYSITDRRDPRAFVVDHVVPLSKGGADTLANKKAAHRSCNAAKAARLIAPIVRRSGSLG